MLTTVVLGFAFGMVAPLLGPSLLAHTRYGPRVGQAYAQFVAKALKRPGIGVGKHGDLSIKQLSFDDLYDQETIESGGVEKKITRTAKNVHRIGATPFTFFDEVFGVTFDLRDVLIGQLEHRHRTDGEMIYTAKEFDREGNPTRVDHYVRAFFELDERPALDMDLDESVRPIVDGSEQAHWWEHMWESVRRMYILRQEEMGILKMLLPFIVAGAVFLLGFYVLGPGAMPGTPSGASDPLSVGALLLLALPAAAEDVPWRKLGAVLGAVVSVALFGMVTVLVGPVTMAIFIGAFAVGAALLPGLTMVAGAAGHGENLGDLFLWAGLSGFDEPVVDLTADDRYRVVEAEEIGLEHPPKVKLAKRLVGLSCDVSAEAFGYAGYRSSDLVDYLPSSSVAADGGEDVLPRGYVATDGIINGGHQGFMPEESALNDSATYVRTDTWLARFKDAATGDALDTAENEAKKEFAAGDPEYDTGQLMKWSVAGSIVSLGFWVVVALVF